MRNSPVVIDRSSETEALIEWGDGHRCRLSAGALRRACACAGCVDEVTGRHLLDPDSLPADLKILAASTVGRYAVTFAFSDGHGTGIYTFERLRALCPCEVPS